MFIADHVVQKKDACVWNVSDCNPIYAQVGHSKLCDAIIVCITQYLQKRMANCNPDPSKSWLAAQDPTTWRRLFWNIDWFNVKIIIQKFGMTRGWSTYESCCEPLNYSDSGFISLDMVYNASWVPIEMGSEYMMFPTTTKKLIDSSTIWFNVEGLVFSTLMFIRMPLRMMKLVVLLVLLHQWMWAWCADKSARNWLSATTRPATSSPTWI